MSWSRRPTLPASSCHIACRTPRSTTLCMLWKLIIDDVYCWAVYADRGRQSTRDEVPTSRRETVFPRQPQRSVQSHRRPLRHVAARSATTTAPTAETDHWRQCVYIASLPLSVIIIIIIIIIIISMGVHKGEGHGGLGPPNDCMIINNIILSGEASLSAENSGKPSDVRRSSPNPAGGAHSAPRRPSWWGGGCCPSQEPHPALGLRPFGRGPSEKYWARRPTP